MIDIKSTEELVQFLHYNKFYIFGTGFVANNFWSYLTNNNINNNAIGFVESEPSKYCFHNIRIYKLSDLAEIKNLTIIVAVHPSIFYQIKDILEFNGFTEWIWIYPFWNELLFNHPYKRDVLIDPYYLIHHACFYERVFCSIYSLGIGYIYNKNNIGKDVFFKFTEMFSSYDTTVQRWNSFSHMTEDFDERNISELGNILFSTDANMILDGHHRLSLALYKRVQRINVDLFHIDYNYISNIFKGHLLSSEDIKRLFTTEESNRILRIIDELPKCNNISQYCSF